MRSGRAGIVLNMDRDPVHIIGGGLAGSEAAWQLARRGVSVILHEMRPERSTDAHQTECLAELVCSNSFRSDDAKYNAVKPSVGIFGDAGALDWTGRGARTGGGAQAGTRDGVVARAKANGLSRDQQMWRDAGALSQKQINSQKRWGGAPKIDVNAAKKPEKKFFGLF